ncbi:hypothetical protein GCM10023224_17410 [Streptomonospora halophila]|uniref:Uncharacterized protein n=1 Tax=Streptomonospora halophila TaxID=427369 RepID=A0ABP9GBM4_9ACTN
MSPRPGGVLVLSPWAPLSKRTLKPREMPPAVPKLDTHPLINEREVVSLTRIRQGGIR